MKNNLDVLYEDNHIIAVNKRNNDIVQGDKTGDESLIDKVKAYIKVKYNKPGDVYLGLPHRLDRPVSGVVVFARTSKALTRLNKMFQDKTVKKTYWAIVEEQPKVLSDTLVHYIKKNQEKNRSHVYSSEKNGAKKASLAYSLINRTKNYFLLEVDLHTGRHHQIRAQLAKIGCCIKGDLKYGAKRSNKEGGISLHARKISFVHPVKGEKIEIKAPVPKIPLWSEFEDL